MRCRNLVKCEACRMALRTPMMLAVLPADVMTVPFTLRLMPCTVATAPDGAVTYEPAGGRGAEPPAVDRLPKGSGTRGGMRRISGPGRCRTRTKGVVGQEHVEDGGVGGEIGSAGASRELRLR